MDATSLAWLSRPGRLHCQPPSLEELQERRSRRWRLLILILVGTTAIALTFHGYTVAGALAAITGIVAAARVVARFVLGTPPRAPRRARPA
jgi:hypothetical protein